MQPAFDLPAEIADELNYLRSRAVQLSTAIDAIRHLMTLDQIEEQRIRAVAADAGLTVKLKALSPAHHRRTRKPAARTATPSQSSGGPSAA